LLSFLHMFAVIETGGKQYLVSPQSKIRVEKLPVTEGQEVVFDKVLLIASDAADLKVGNPYVAGAKVMGKVLKQGRGKKIRIFKYKSKVRYRRRKGYRQEFTDVEILKI
jgi:large subunit ribosomal protein L21